MDLVLKLQEKMSIRVTYNKVFQKEWGASGKSKNKYSISIEVLYLQVVLCVL